jgi:hypothetical protein
VINRKQLFKVARVVRRCAEEMVDNDDQGTNWVSKRHLGGGCGDVSLVFAQLTGLCHCFESGDYNGDGHCWVRLPSGEIWDLTATQFEVAAKVHIASGEKATPYSTYRRGRLAISGLELWADSKWRARLRNAVRAELRKADIM